MERFRAAMKRPWPAPWHDAYTLTPKGEPLLGGRRGADGAIVIVRDPRDLAPSLANHNRVDIDNAIMLMNDRAAEMPPRRSIGKSHIAACSQVTCTVMSGRCRPGPDETPRLGSP